MEVQTDSVTVIDLIALVDNDHIDEALQILDTSDAKERFLEPWGSPQLALVRIAARQGSLKVLDRLHALGADLDIADAFGSCALHHAALKGRVNVVKWFLDRGVADGKRTETWPRNHLSFPDSSGSTALHEAIRGLHVDVVQLLVEAGVDVDVQDDAGYTPLLMACFMVDTYYQNCVSRFEKIVDILMSASASVNIVHPETGMTPIHYAVRVNSREATKRLLICGACLSARSASDWSTPLHIAAESGFHRLLCILLEYMNTSMIDVPDKFGRTPLYVAAMGSHLKCVNTLVNNGGSLASETKNRQTVIDALFKYDERPIAFLTDILDAQVHATESTINTVTLDFRVLAPQDERQMAVISALIRAVPRMEQMTILQHPLIEAFLGLKWTRLSYLFIILVTFQALFVACLFTYGFSLLQEDFDRRTPRIMLFICASILLCHNTLQILMIPKYYAKQFATWLSIICAMICLVVVVAGECNLDSMEAGPSEDANQLRNRGQRSSWVLQSISVAIVVACIQVMLLIGRFPTWGYYALMFSTALKNVSKVFLAVVWIIVGFSLSFSVLFHGNDQFDNPGKAFVKTVVMMMGEYEYSELFASTDEENSTVNNLNYDGSRHTVLPVTCRIVFLVFVMFTSIVLMNLMIGLAVSDIQGLLNEGLIRRLLKQAEFVTHLERVTSHWIFCSRLVPRRLTEMLESKNKIPTRIDLELLAKHGKRPRGISEKLIEKLFDLAAKNRNHHKKLQRTLSYQKNEDTLSEIIFYLEEGVKKLQQEKIRIGGI